MAGKWRCLMEALGYAATGNKGKKASNCEEPNLVRREEIDPEQRSAAAALVWGAA